MVFEVVKVNALEAEATGTFLIGLDGCSHNAIFSVPLLGLDEPRCGHPRVVVTSNTMGMEEIRDVSDAQLATSIAQSSEVALAEAYGVTEVPSMAWLVEW